MKKIMIALSCLTAFSCAANKVEENRKPAQIGNIGTFKTFSGNPLTNRCLVIIQELPSHEILHDAVITTFEEKKPMQWGTASSCLGSRESGPSQVFKDSKNTVIDFCFKMSDAHTGDIDSGYAEVYVVRRTLQKGIPLATSPMEYLNKENPIIINGRGHSNLAIGKFKYKVQCEPQGLPN